MTHTVFERCCRRTVQVARVVQPLHDARGLAAADSVEGFVLGYTSLLEAYPGLKRRPHHAWHTHCIYEWRYCRLGTRSDIGIASA